jgi:hypothetical protein
MPVSTIDLFFQACPMKYMMTIPLTSSGYKERVERFLDTGALPPAGATMLGRWHTVGHNKCYMQVEAANPEPIYQWVSNWADIINFEVEPVLEDAQIAKILKAL